MLLQSQHHYILTFSFPFSFSFSYHHHRHHPNPSKCIHFLSPPLAHTSHQVSLARPKSDQQPPWLAAQASSESTGTTGTTTTAKEEEEGGGPVEFFTPSTPIFATDDEPSPIQVATSVLLTGAIAVFLFRSLRRRARRAKELKFRSSGVKKSLKEEALDNLKAMGSASIEPKGPPSPVQALLGAISAGVIAVILYKFTTTIEAALNRQTISDSYSIETSEEIGKESFRKPYVVAVRQITITIRTIVNGLCYLATFVFGINSIGLFLYAGQLAINSFMEGSTDEETESKGDEQSSSMTSTIESPTSNIDSSKDDQGSVD